MIEPRSPQVVVVLLCLFVALAAVPSALGQTPVVSDSFNPTSPERQPGMPIENAPLERGHGRWTATGGMTFGDGGTATGHENSEFAGIRFVPVEHQRSAIVVVETDIYPGSEGWVGVGFAGEDLGPLPSKGEIWVKLHHLGKVAVYADGARIKLYKESHPNPAFVQGMNRVRLSYNRRSNTARAWLNDIELPLDDLSETGFTPSISTIAFHLWKSEAQGSDAPGGEAPKVIDDPLMGRITGAIEDSFLGESFTLVKGSSVRRKDGPLNGVTVQYYSSEPEQWQATSAVGFGQNYATNRQQTAPAAPVVAVLPFDPRDAYGFAVSSVEAVVKPVSATWVAIGLAGPPGQEFVRFEQGGQLWARLFNTGVLQVLAQGTEHLLFDDPVIDPELLYLGVRITLAFDRVNMTAAVWVNEQPVALAQSLAATGYVPAIAFGGFQAYRDGGFSVKNQFAVDDFAIRVSSPIPPLTVVNSPSTIIAVEGWRAKLTCGATGGVEPYSYRWQQYTGAGFTGWADLEEGVEGYYQTNQSTLVIPYPDSTHDGRSHKCVARDSNYGDIEAESASAQLIVRAAAVGDRFNNGPGQTVGDPLDGVISGFGEAEWRATEATVFGINSITNAVTNPVAIDVLGSLDIPDVIALTYRNLLVEAKLSIGSAEWAGVGFSPWSLNGLMGSGTLWVKLSNTGRVKIHANGIVYTLFDQIVLTAQELEDPVHVQLEYDKDESTASVWINGDQIMLDQSLAEATDGQYVPPVDGVKFHLRRSTGFTTPFAIGVDDFALTGDDEAPAPTMAVNPQSQQVGLGFDPQLTCGATGGVPPYSYSWERYNGFAGWLELEEVHPFSGTTTSTLTVADFDLSLEGLYRCTVTDGRPDPSPVNSASATLSALLPDFSVQANQDYWVFTASRTSDGAPAGWLQTGIEHDLHIAVSAGAPIADDYAIPLTVWGSCHPLGADPTEDWTQLGAADGYNVQPDGEIDWYTVPIVVPDSCVDPQGGGTGWAVVTLRIDVNAEVDPADPFGYPDDISRGRAVVPENGYNFDNRAELQSWAPAARGPLDQAVSAGHIMTKDFDLQNDAPDENYYPTPWTAASSGSGELNFSLPVLGSTTIEQLIGEDYQPYMVWPGITPNQVPPVAVMVRYRRNGASYTQEDFLLAGYTEGTPPLLPGDATAPAARLGPDDQGGGDSTNLLSPHYRYQYRVVAWQVESGGPFQDPNYADHSDGVAPLEIPDFPDGGAATGSWASLYLGFKKGCVRTWGLGPCVWNGYQWFWLDYVRVWGSGSPPPPQAPDYRATRIVVEGAAPGDWVEIPDEVAIRDELRVCVEIEGPVNALPPDGARLAHTPPGGGVTEYSAYVVDATNPFVFCPQDGSVMAPWVAQPAGLHMFQGCAVDDDPHPENNCMTDPDTVTVYDTCPVPAVVLP